MWSLMAPDLQTLLQMLLEMADYCPQLNTGPLSCHSTRIIELCSQWTVTATNANALYMRIIKLQQNSSNFIKLHQTSFVSKNQSTAALCTLPAYLMMLLVKPTYMGETVSPRTASNA